MNLYCSLLLIFSACSDSVEVKKITEAWRGYLHVAEKLSYSINIERYRNEKKDMSFYLTFKRGENSEESFEIKEIDYNKNKLRIDHYIYCRNNDNAFQLQRVNDDWLMMNCSDPNSNEADYINKEIKRGETYTLVPYKILGFDIIALMNNKKIEFIEAEPINNGNEISARAKYKFSSDPKDYLRNFSFALNRLRNYCINKYAVECKFAEGSSVTSGEIKYKLLDTLNVPSSSDQATRYEMTGGKITVEKLNTKYEFTNTIYHSYYFSLPAFGLPDVAINKKIVGSLPSSYEIPWAVCVALGGIILLIMAIIIQKRRNLIKSN